MDIAALIASVALQVGAPIVKGMIEDRFGKTGGRMAGTVIDAVAKQAGVTPEALPDLNQSNPEKVQAAVTSVEQMAPEMIALYMAGVQGQFQLAQTEAKEGGAAAAWRWGWMYLLGFFWTWVVVIVPAVNAGTGAHVQIVEIGVLLTLTSWFIALYMGGHTLKELGKNAADAVKGRRAGS